jgi:Holliday junction resolvase
MLVSKIVKIGRDTEELVANFLSKEGWFVIIIPSKSTGQPFDLIAFKDGDYFTADVKHVAAGYEFQTSRIEANQISSFRLMIELGNTNCGLLIKYEDENDLYYKPFVEIDLNEKFIKKEECYKI